MIFVTVGSELPFDRLLNVVDKWAATTQKKVVAQVGSTQHPPKNIMKWDQFISQTEFLDHIVHSDVIVAHAGMGSILMAMQNQKPIIIMPRRAKYRETRNDHQVATANKLNGISGIYVAMDEVELESHLAAIDSFVSGRALSPYASCELLSAIEGFIDE